MTTTLGGVDDMAWSDAPRNRPQRRAESPPESRECNRENPGAQAMVAESLAAEACMAGGSGCDGCMTDWDALWRAGETPWEKGMAAPPLEELFERVNPAIWGDGPVLVPGCGSGHDVRALAARGIPAVGVDVSPAAVERARTHPPVDGAVVELGDFLEPGWGGGRTFSALWEHTCFCAISPVDRPRYAQAAARLIVPGGVLAGLFFLNPYDPGEEASGPPHPSEVDGIEALFGRWFERMDDWVPTRAYPGREGREWLALYRRRAE